MNAQGETIECVVQLDNVDAEYKRSVCSHFEKRFTPALDESGHPVPSFYETAVVYMVS